LAACFFDQRFSARALAFGGRNYVLPKTFWIGPRDAPLWCVIRALSTT
jgi:hypothetical protein